jgi:hypothetical protein
MPELCEFERRPFGASGRTNPLRAPASSSIREVERLGANRARPMELDHPVNHEKGPLSRAFRHRGEVAVRDPPQAPAAEG